MLLNLHIKNMALIDEIDIDFFNNLNILTGETGAGKSIVIDSISIALGGKTPKDFVRQDAEFGMVELVFSIDSNETIDKLLDLDIPSAKDGEIIISRKIIGSRSISKINGETVTLSKVRDVSSLLLDMHAQHEHQSLLIPENHMKLLDKYGYHNIASMKEEVSKLYKEYISIKRELDEHTINEAEKKRNLDLMEYELKEIHDANLLEGEDEQLEENYKIALNYKKIVENLNQAVQVVDEDGSNAIDFATRSLSSIVNYDSQLLSMSDLLATISDLMLDFSRSAKNYLSDDSYSDKEFYVMEKRLDQLNHLKSKYGNSISEIIAYQEQIEEEYEKLMNHDSYILDLKNQLEKILLKLEDASLVLHEERKKLAKKLTNDIKNALIDLNFLDVQFDMQFEELDHYTEQGKDHAYFIISTNPGEYMKPLWQVASGGELSRIMLAIKSCLADSDRIETLIFDEIDVGISGRTAQMVAEKISKIGQLHQVICITHLAQIAAMADHHFLIEKHVEDQKTITDIYKLDQKAEIYELARLIGGVKITDTVLESAKEMKELANKVNLN